MFKFLQDDLSILRKLKTEDSTFLQSVLDCILLIFGRIWEKRGSNLFIKYKRLRNTDLKNPILYTHVKLLMVNKVTLVIKIDPV